jgi:hypothetical protein
LYYIEIISPEGLEKSRGWCTMRYDEQDKQQQVEFQDGPMDAYSVKLTSWHARMARRLGSGNLSRGMRIALEIVMGFGKDKESPKEK